MSQTDSVIACLQAEGSQTERQQFKTMSKKGHVCVPRNPGNPHSEFLICFCKRDLEMIRCSSASLE